MPSNSIDTIIFTKEGQKEHRCLQHLYDLQVIIPDFIFEDGRIDKVCVSIRPTNHVYSRALNQKDDDQIALKNNGQLLLKYEHLESDPLQPAPGKTLSTDIRVFCEIKYQASKLLPEFVQELNQNPKNICALANRGDDRTCLSALFKAQTDNRYYIVLFRFHKKSSTEANMVIETAFLAEENDFRVNLLKSPKNKAHTRPFLTLLRNIFAGRRPFEGKKMSKKRHKRKAEKKKP